jgi:hypothetical protein
MTGRVEPGQAAPIFRLHNSVNARQWGSPESVDTLTWLIFPVRAS